MEINKVIEVLKGWKKKVQEKFCTEPETKELEAYQKVLDYAITSLGIQLMFNDILDFWYANHEWAGWVKESEKKPEDPEEMVLVQVSGRFDGVDMEHAFTHAWHEPGYGWTLKEYPYAKRDQFTVEAWMHLPHEYKEER